MAVRVRVTDERSEPLAGSAGCRYDSPPHTESDALALVRVLLGFEPGPGQSRWDRPIAGGRRLVELADVEEVER